MVREIPKGSIEVQKGLWLYSKTKIILGQTKTLYELYSSEGYCFYDKSQEMVQQNNENESEDKTHIFWQWMSLGFDNNTSMYVSIPISEMPENGNIA